MHAFEERSWSTDVNCRSDHGKLAWLQPGMKPACVFTWYFGQRISLCSFLFGALIKAWGVIDLRCDQLSASYQGWRQKHFLLNHTRKNILFQKWSPEKKNVLRRWGRIRTTWHVLHQVKRALLKRCRVYVDSLAAFPPLTESLSPLINRVAMLSELKY